MAIENTYLLGKNIILGCGFDLQAKAPLDSRQTVPSTSGLQALINGDAAYEGMIVYDEESKKTYQAQKCEPYTVTIGEGDDAVEKTYSIKFQEFGINESELKALIASETTAAMEFKGATTALPENPAKGDMWKVTASFEVAGETAKVGDSIVYNGEEWFRIPSGDDIEDTWRPITDVNNDATLTFAAGDKLDVTVSTNGTITYKHEAIDAPTATPVGEDEQTRTYIASIETDGFGHITGYKTATENVEDTNTTYEFEGLPVSEDQGAPSSVYFQVKSSEEEAAEVVYLDTYSKQEADAKFAKAGDLGDLASKDKVSLSDFDDALSLSVSGWNSTQRTVSQNVEKWNTAATTVAEKEIYWGLGAQTAATALQTVKVLGTTLNQSYSELTVDAAKTALGLGTAAYESKDSFVATTGDQTIAGTKTFEDEIVLNRNEGATVKVNTSADGVYAFTPSYTVYDDHSIRANYGGGADLHYNFNDNGSTGDAKYADENNNVTIATREFVEAQGYITDVSGKADIVADATDGNFAGLDADGNLTDSGKCADDFVQTTGDQTIGGVKTFSDEFKVHLNPEGVPHLKVSQYEIQLCLGAGADAIGLDGEGAFFRKDGHTLRLPSTEGTLTTEAYVKDTYIGNTNATVEDVVKAVNKLSTGAENANTAIGDINSNIDAIVTILTWDSF